LHFGSQPVKNEAEDCDGETHHCHKDNPQLIEQIADTIVDKKPGRLSAIMCEVLHFFKRGLLMGVRVVVTCFWGNWKRVEVANLFFWWCGMVIARVAAVRMLLAPFLLAAYVEVQMDSLAGGGLYVAALAILLIAHNVFGVTEWQLVFSVLSFVGVHLIPGGTERF
jgi:hypothetical protein